MIRVYAFSQRIAFRNTCARHMNSETKLLFVLCSSDTHSVQYKVLVEDKIQ